jgi:hypothetical protein
MWPFTIHQDGRFKKLLKKLESLNIIEIMTKGDSKKITIIERQTLIKIFACIFILYTFPQTQEKPLQAISYCKRKGKLISKGGFFNISYTNKLPNKVCQILDILVTDEGDGAIEHAFNALLSVFIASNFFLNFIFPNTYIVELGRKTHEIDICLGKDPQTCIIFETTRGFNKEADEIDESYSWHLKKALFRKWAIDKLFNTNCILIYITLRWNQSTAGLLIEEVLKIEEDTVAIIQLSSIFEDPPTFEEIEKIIEKRLISSIEKEIISLSPK